MFPLEQGIIDKYRRFWCNIALKHPEEWWKSASVADRAEFAVAGAAFDNNLEDWWYRDLPYQRIRLPIITKAIWDEMVAWARLREAKEAYRETRSRFSDELDEQEIGSYELGSGLRIRGGGP